jgi:ABC-2 type transport system ATP-binding protein
MYLLLKSLRKYPEVLDCYAFGAYVHVSFKNAFEARALEAYLRKEGLSEIEMKPATASIEDCFIKLLKS